MTRIKRLRAEARQAAKSRGHDMQPFRYVRDYYISHCNHCRKDMTVIPKPAPNETEISGPAVALNCTRRV